MTNLITLHALLSPTYLLNVVTPKIAPFHPPTTKNQTWSGSDDPLRIYGHLIFFWKSRGRSSVASRSSTYTSYSNLIYSSLLRSARGVKKLLHEFSRNDEYICTTYYWWTIDDFFSLGASLSRKACCSSCACNVLLPVAAEIVGRLLYVRRWVMLRAAVWKGKIRHCFNSASSVWPPLQR